MKQETEKGSKIDEAAAREGGGAAAVGVGTGAVAKRGCNFFPPPWGTLFGL